MRISVIGPQNTGKSTFIKDFLFEFKKYITPKETYRDVVEKNSLKINQETTEESQRMIRDFLFNQLKENKIDNIIFDRSVIDNYVYTKIQFDKGKIEKNFLDETKRLMDESLSHLDAFVFIPTAASVLLVDDKLRDTDRLFIDKVNKVFIETIFNIARISKIRIATITGDRIERIRQVKEKLGI